MTASPVVIQLDDVGEMLARPAAKRFAAFAAAIDCIGEANLQARFLWLFGSFLDAQWERVKIQERISIVNQPAGRNVTVAKNHVMPRMLRRVISNETDETEPVGVAMIVPIHDF